MRHRPELSVPRGLTRMFCLALVLLTASCGDRGETEPGPDDEAAPGAERPSRRPGEPGYGTTLARLPVSFETTGSLSGAGSVTARVDGSRLLVEGAYEGLESPATEAHLHRARPGLRGPVVAPLELGGGGSTDGTLNGSTELTEDLRQALEARELYVQIHSVDNPDGVLRGWLFPER